MAGSTPKKSREDRLAEKLRENLKRRKSQARARLSSESEVPEGKAAQPAASQLRRNK